MKLGQDDSCKSPIFGNPPGHATFEELSWVGRTLQIGKATFEVVEPIVRCRATEYDWYGSRTTDFLDRLDRQLNTDICGLFLRSLDDSEIVESDELIMIN